MKTYLNLKEDLIQLLNTTRLDKYLHPTGSYVTFFKKDRYSNPLIITVELNNNQSVDVHLDGKKLKIPISNLIKTVTELSQIKNIRNQWGIQSFSKIKKGLYTYLFIDDYNSSNEDYNPSNNQEKPSSSWTDEELHRAIYKENYGIDI